MKTTVNKLMLTGLLGLTLAAGTAQAGGANNEGGGIGFGLGAVLGALAGGPPGLVLGAAGGALIGLDGDRQQALQASEQRRLAAGQAVAEKEREMLAAHTELARRHQMKMVAMQDMARQLSEQRSTHRAMQQRMQGMIESLVFTVQFRTGSDVLEPHYQAHVERLAQTLKLLPDLKLHLTGYADPRGSEHDNLDLAQHRIDSVRGIFKAAGLADDRIAETALGEQGVAQDGDREAYPFDRRVLIAFSHDGDGGI